MSEITLCSKHADLVRKEKDCTLCTLEFQGNEAQGVIAILNAEISRREAEVEAKIDEMRQIRYGGNIKAACRFVDDLWELVKLVKESK